MIDAGSGSLLRPDARQAGRQPASAAGYQPEQVDEIYITHMHGDHVGGLICRRQDRVSECDRARRPARRRLLAQSRRIIDAAPNDAKSFFEGAMASMNPYIAAGKFQPFDGDTELVPGVRALAAYGHTPGHTVYVVESQGPRTCALGRPDARRCRAVSLSRR